eukprot:12422606-Karenia_brevis.AAC.1
MTHQATNEPSATIPSEMQDDYTQFLTQSDDTEFVASCDALKPNAKHRPEFNADANPNLQRPIRPHFELPAQPNRQSSHSC